MCLPAAIAIPMALAAAGTAASVVGQIQAANAANKAIEAQRNERNHEIDLKASEEISARLREARREQGRIMVAAGESGLNTSSPVVQNLLTDASMQATLANQESLANRASRRRATDAEANAAMVSKPTLLGAGLQIALSAGQSFVSSGGIEDAQSHPGGLI